MHTNFTDAMVFILSALFFLILTFIIGRNLHKAAYPTVFFALLIYVGFNIAMWRIFHALPFVTYVLVVISTLLLLAVAYFFRKPPTPKNNLDRDVISPAYGKVVNVAPGVQHELLDTPGTLISIFMSPLNIHANFIPAKGKVIYANHFPGEYLMAFHPKSSERNEHTRVIVETSFGKVLIKQIAGFMARRIITYVQQNDAVDQGDEIGFIKFGSRVDIIVPSALKVHVKEGEKVRGGQTILASLTE